MDIPVRLVVAYSIIATGLALSIPALILGLRRRRRRLLRLRGVKDYNRSRGVRAERQ